MLPRLSDFVHQFLECGLIFATCKRNYVFAQKTFFIVQIATIGYSLGVCVCVGVSV